MSNIEKFFAFLKAADAITVDDGAMLTSWETEACTGVGDNQVVRFDWTDGECDYSCVFDESGIAAGVFSNDGIFVGNDHEGERTIIQFFTIQRITSA